MHKHKEKVDKSKDVSRDNINEGYFKIAACLIEQQFNMATSAEETVVTIQSRAKLSKDDLMSFIKNVFTHGMKHLYKKLLESDKVFFKVRANGLFQFLKQQPSDCDGIFCITKAGETLILEEFRSSKQNNVGFICINDKSNKNQTSFLYPLLRTTFNKETQKSTSFKVFLFLLGQRWGKLRLQSNCKDLSIEQEIKAISDNLIAVLKEYFKKNRSLFAEFFILVATQHSRLVAPDAENKLKNTYFSAAHKGLKARLKQFDIKGLAEEFSRLSSQYGTEFPLILGVLLKDLKQLKCEDVVLKSLERQIEQMLSSEFSPDTSDLETSIESFATLLKTREHFFTDVSSLKSIYQLSGLDVGDFITKNSSDNEETPSITRVSDVEDETTKQTELFNSDNKQPDSSKASLFAIGLPALSSIEALTSTSVSGSSADENETETQSASSISDREGQMENPSSLTAADTPKVIQELINQVEEVIILLGVCEKVVLELTVLENATFATQKFLLEQQKAYETGNFDDSMHNILLELKNYYENDLFESFLKKHKRILDIFSRLRIRSNDKVFYSFDAIYYCLKDYKSGNISLCPDVITAVNEHRKCIETFAIVMGKLNVLMKQIDAKGFEFQTILSKIQKYLNSDAYPNQHKFLLIGLARKLFDFYGIQCINKVKEPLSNLKATLQQVRDRIDETDEIIQKSDILRRILSKEQSTIAKRLMPLSELSTWARSTSVGQIEQPPTDSVTSNGNQESSQVKKSGGKFGRIRRGLRLTRQLSHHNLQSSRINRSQHSSSTTPTTGDDEKQSSSNTSPKPGSPNG